MYYPPIDILAKDKKALFNELSECGISTGFTKLDDCHILMPGNFCVIGALPCMGKKALIYKMMQKHLKENVPVAFLTTRNLDHPASWARLVSSLKGDYERIYSIKNSIDYINNADVDEMPIYITSTPLLTIDKICQTVRQLVFDNGVKVIYLESLQSIAMAEEAPTEECIKTVCLKLKALAYELHVPIIVTSDVDARKIDERTGFYGKTPEASDLKGCKYIKDIADVILLLFRPEYYHFYEDENGEDMKGKIIIIVDKNEHGSMRWISLGICCHHIFEPNSDEDPFHKHTMTSEELDEIASKTPGMKNFIDKLQLEIPEQ